VFTWYCKDQELNASVFKKVSKTYFLKVLMRRAPPVRTHASQVWRQRKNEVKLHRWLRFTKCTECTDLRAIRRDSKSTLAEKRQAGNDLREHYLWVKRERQETHLKKVRAMLEPRKYLSLAIDGTDQLPHGLPQFRDQTTASHAAHHRLMYKFVLVEAHGIGVYSYDHLENIAQDPNLTIECLQRTLRKVLQFRTTLPLPTWMERRSRRILEDFQRCCTSKWTTAGGRTRTTQS